MTKPLSHPDLYKLSTNVDPFMKTQRQSNGYTTSYAQIRVHHGTHVDFPRHVGLEGEPQWNISGPAKIVDSHTKFPETNDVLFFNTDGRKLAASVVDKVVDHSNSISVVGTDHTKIGDLEDHKRLLDNGVYIVENLVNLEEPPSNTGYAFCFATILNGCKDGAVVSIAFNPSDGGKST